MPRKPVVTFVFWLNTVTGLLEVVSLVILALPAFVLGLFVAGGGHAEVTLGVWAFGVVMFALAFVRLYSAASLRALRAWAPWVLLVVALLDAAVHLVLAFLIREGQEPRFTSFGLGLAAPALLNLLTAFLLLHPRFRRPSPA